MRFSLALILAVVPFVAAVCPEIQLETQTKNKTDM